MHPTLRVKTNNDGTSTVSGQCIYTQKPYSVTVDTEGLKKYQDGELIQRALSKVPMEQREFLISGASPEGWELIFGSEE